MLEIGGTLYISFPIGNRNSIYFNAHRVFHPLEIFKWPKVDSLILKRFDFVGDDGRLYSKVNINENNINVKYGCGIYTFNKFK